MTRTCFVHANLLDGDHPPKPDSTVVVDGNRIVTVTDGEVATEPADAVIDCAGRTLMPGMVSGHFHPAYRDVTGALMPPLGFERPPAMHAYVAAHNAGLAIRAGVTSVVGAGAVFDVDPSLRDAINEGLVIGPRVVAGSRDLITTADSNDTTPWYWEAQALGGVRLCDGADAFRKAVRDEIRRGVDVVKLFPTGGHGIRLSGDTMSMTQAELNAAVEAAHGLGARARAHVASKAGIMRCLEAGVDILDHCDGLDEECVHAIAEAGAFVLPSLYMIAYKLHMDGIADLNTSDSDSPLLAAFRRMCQMLPVAVEAGVQLCLGDDYGGIFLKHGTYGREPAMYVEHTGLAPLEVLRWATVNGGALVGRDDLGRIEQGYLADMIVVDGDPSSDIAVLAEPDNVRAVMRDGQLLINTLQ